MEVAGYGASEYAREASIVGLEKVKWEFETALELCFIKNNRNGHGTEDFTK